jgi:hypothetical protein
VAACRSIPGAADVEQDRPARAVSDRPVDGLPDRGRQRNRDDLGAFAAHAKHSAAMLFAEVADIGGVSLEDPQAEQPQHGH